ncbi:NAD-dependent deacetylase [Sporolactobacillus shoreae]|uniref:protein acetyllysine N-acetyltransferase n=1 Tax=Sporolactobacillus shoreae TaxID=1465501 RepID=A0A4Z0GHC9_9BACL|nr:Sir2 family NAD-dependent protein deacetylase [Sporolactobacillus shoreae]TGA96070.1 NAD-dependent deacetylase [Sporolactobacillus shoreae]
MQTLNQLVENDLNIAVLTGAGVSVPSEIPPFRGTNGLYQNADVERCLNIDFFQSHPEEFWIFYWTLFDADLLLSAQPNPVHQWLKDLENRRDVTVITQNIDGLHVKAGSSNVIEVHGSFARAVCPKCGTVYQTQAIGAQSFPHCSLITGKGEVCGAVLKPDIVLFGEAVRGFDEAERAIRNADRLIILGTSLGVTPANMLPLYAKMQGVPTLLVNDRRALQMDYIDRFIHMDFNQFNPDQIIG